MKLKSGCNAAWYELNISAADDCVSACCYYAGPKDNWSDELRTVDAYWNSPNMQKIREINTTPDAKLGGGCEGCYFFGHRGESGLYFSDFLKPRQDLSPAQEKNWLAAIDDYKSGRRRVSSTPLRYYVNFGFACNLSCIMCHQVPRRRKLRRQVPADFLLKWRPYLKAAIDITAIGGEPFAMVEAAKFIRAVIDDPELDDVQLTICTNGTLHHRHMDTLVRKRKLQLAISLDTIGEEFEQIRVGASWNQIERNILMFLETGKRLGYPWTVQAPAMLLKTNVPRLPDFVDWAIAHDVEPGFYDFVNARGIERAFEAENVVAYPHLLEQVPGWEDCFISAIEKLRASTFSLAGDQLNGLFTQIKHNLARMAESEIDAAAGKTGWWERLYGVLGKTFFEDLQKNVYGGSINDEVVSLVDAGIFFKPTHLNDHLATPYLDLPLHSDENRNRVRLKAGWGQQVDLESALPRCRIYLQDDKSRPLREIFVSGQTPVPGQIVRYFAVEDDARKVRAVFNPYEMEETLVPNEITLERASAQG